MGSSGWAGRLSWCSRAHCEHRKNNQSGRSIAWPKTRIQLQAKAVKAFQLEAPTASIDAGLARLNHTYNGPYGSVNILVEISGGSTASPKG